MQVLIMNPDELKGNQAVPVKVSGEKKYIYGLSGLAALLNCSRMTASRIKSSGKVPYHQVGRKLIFEENAVMAAIGKQQITA